MPDHVLQMMYVAVSGTEHELQLVITAACPSHLLMYFTGQPQNHRFEYQMVIIT